MRSLERDLKAKMIDTAHQDYNNVDIAVTVMIKSKYFICYVLKFRKNEYFNISLDLEEIWKR